jgi:hypothetical protein
MDPIRSGESLTARGFAAAIERAALQRRRVRVLVCAQVLGGFGIGVGASISPLLAKEILGGDGTFAGLAFASFMLGRFAAVASGWGPGW